MERFIFDLQRFDPAKGAPMNMESGTKNAPVIYEAYSDGSSSNLVNLGSYVSIKAYGMQDVILSSGASHVTVDADRRQIRLPLPL